MFTYQIYIFIWSEFFLQVLERQTVAMRRTVQGVHHLLHYDSWDKLQHAMTLGMFGWMNKRTIKPKNGFLGLTKWHIDNFSRLALLPHHLLAYHTAVRLILQHKKDLAMNCWLGQFFPFWHSNQQQETWKEARWDAIWRPSWAKPRLTVLPKHAAHLQ